jgi:hypothetical protein
MKNQKLLQPLRYDVEDGETVYAPNGEWVDSGDFDDLAEAYKELKADADRMARELIKLRNENPKG